MCVCVRRALMSHRRISSNLNSNAYEHVSFFVHLIPNCFFLCEAIWLTYTHSFMLAWATFIFKLVAYLLLKNRFSCEFKLPEKRMRQIRKHFVRWLSSHFEISLGLSFIESRTMKLFIYLISQYKVLGICPVQNIQTHARNGLHIFFVAQLSITGLVYLVFEANTIPEYVDSFYAFSTGLVNVFSFIVIISKMERIYQLIEELEKSIQQRNQQAIYGKLNERIEQFSKRFYFIYVQCTSVGVVMPVFLSTLFVYFTTDLGRDAFQLPFLASWVKRNVLKGKIFLL